MILLCLMLAFCLFLIVGMLCSIGLRVTQYEVQLSGIQDDVRLLFLTDLHGKAFGQDSRRLLECIAAQQPELILLPGDLIDRNADAQQLAETLAFCGELTKVAPTYFSLGNHEMDYLATNGNGFLHTLASQGVHVLECEYEELELHGTKLRLGGMCELAYYGGDGKYDPNAETFLSDYCDTELPKVLLSHRPEAFCFKHACLDWDVDLILSGHTHGGMLRLPLVGGVIAPIQGFFPKVDYGEYTFYDTKMIVTSGLAGYEGIPRLYNPPEICVVTLTKTLEELSIK